ncbi:MAG: hypothetical protein ABL883_09360 [Terricaulis sp.]
MLARGGIVRALDIAFASIVLRLAPARPSKPQRELVPAIDPADPATLDRAALGQDRAALVASLWPAPRRQCVISAKYFLLDAPAGFGQLWVISRTQEAVQAPEMRRAIAA